MQGLRDILTSRAFEFIGVFVSVFAAHFLWYAALSFWPTHKLKGNGSKVPVFTARDLQEAMTFLDDWSKKPVQMVVDANTYAMAVQGWASANRKLAEIRAATAVLDQKVSQDERG